jgi:hypothetical protein
MTSHALQDLINSIYKNYPNLCDPWEIVAIIEELGYTDQAIESKFGCPDALVLGQFIYAQRDQFPFIEVELDPTKNKSKLADEIRIFISHFSNSFVYTIPFIVLLLINYLPIKNKVDVLPAELNSLFGFVTMASLITSSGFVQMISRKGLFYIGLKDPIQANRICIPILLMGIFTTIFLSSIGIIFGFYQGIAADGYTIIAGIYYVILSIIWMLSAIVKIQYQFAALRILIVITCCFFWLRVFAKFSMLDAQLATVSIAFGSLVILSIINQIKHRPIKPKFGKLPPLPQLSVLVYLLAPYFWYGIIYFGLIFADRLVANIAIASRFSLILGNSLTYQNSMDLALLNLLLIVPLVEYCSYKLITYWNDRAKSMTLTEADSLAWILQKKYWSSVNRVLLYFGILMTLTIVLLLMLDRRQADNILTLVGSVGYLLFAIGLFNTMILISLDRLPDMLGILTMAMLLDLTIGYLLSSLFGIYFAVIGLVVGATFFAVCSSQKVLQAIDRAQYCYFYSGLR